MMRTALLLLGMFASAAGAASPIDPAAMSATVRTLASEPFAGRAPGGAGEAPTVDYLVGRFKDLGLTAGGRAGAWTQTVPLVRTQIGKGGRLAVSGKPLVEGRDIYVSTVRPVDRIAIAGAPIVFVGYGVTAPERRWDDFKGQDLKGKVAVMLVNDPDFEAGAGDDSVGRFGGKRMTFYGRWVYKYEEAARRGAIAALIVHDTPGAGYGWNTVVAPGGENYDIVRKDISSRILMQGWIEGAAADALFRSAGLDLAALRASARRSDFRPVELKGLRFDADLPVSHAVVESHNVLAKIDGTKRPGEVVMYGAHWDAYGVGAPDAQGRTIRPGANDDGLGVAGLIEIAKAMMKGPKPERSVVFGVWTGEERGLLGSEAYATDPIYPIAKTVANITLDVLQTAGPARDVILVGDGQSDLEDDLATLAKAQGRTVTPETLPERGLFYRADHFPVARRGVPSILLMALGGKPDLIAGGKPAGAAWLKSYMACYHQTCDLWDAGWDLRGAAQDTELALDLGLGLANSTRWPDWRPTSEFKALRAETASARQ